MTEEMVLIYPSKNIFIDISNNINKYISINLYNKKDIKISYTINSIEENNIFQIENENRESILNPFANKEIKILVNNNINNNNTMNNNKYELNFIFKEFNNDKISQKIIINIYSKGKIKEGINQYLKFKEELNNINNKIKDIIVKEEANFENKKKKIKLREIICILIIIIIFGILFGIKLSKIYKNIFKKKINAKTVKTKEDEENDVVKFMTNEEKENLNKLNLENHEKYERLFNFNFLEEVKKKKNINNNATNDKNFSFLINIKIYLFIILIFFIF